MVTKLNLRRDQDCTSRGKNTDFVFVHQALPIPNGEISRRLLGSVETKFCTILATESGYQASDSSTGFTISLIFQSFSVRRAAIAGGMRTAEFMRAKLYQRVWARLSEATPAAGMAGLRGRLMIALAPQKRIGVAVWGAMNTDRHCKQHQDDDPGDLPFGNHSKFSVSFTGSRLRQPPELYRRRHGGRGDCEAAY
jgi:hypothetical protein